MRMHTRLPRLIAVYCVLAFVLSFFFLSGSAVSAEPDNRVTAATNGSVKQGNSAYCYVYIDSLESVSTLEVTVHFDPNAVSVTGSYNQVSAQLYDSATTESTLQYTYIFDGNGAKEKTQLFYFQYTVLPTAPVGTTYFDVVVGDAYDASFQLLPISGSRCAFEVTEAVTDLTCSVRGTSSVSTAVNQEFTLTYRFSTAAIASGSAVIRYDAELFALQEVEQGSFLDNKMTDMNTSLSGAVYVSFLGSEYSSQTQFLTLRFKTLQNVSRTDSITLTLTDLYDLELNAITCSGYSTMVSVTHDPTYDENAPYVRLQSDYDVQTRQLTVRALLEENSHLGAGDFVLQFDPTRFSYVSSVKGYSPTFFTINDKQTDEGVLKFSVISLTDHTAAVTMLTVTFDVIAPCENTASQLTISGSGLADHLTNAIVLNFTGCTAETVGHTPITDVAVPPTCLDTGLTEGAHCGVCGEILLAQESIPALGHDEIHHTPQAVTCLEIGWSAYVTCSRCDYTTYSEIPALGHDRIRHDAQAPTCLEIGWDAYETCSRCDYTTYVEIEPLGHDLEQHSEKSPDCTNIGWGAYETCSRCDYTTYAEIEPLGHDAISHAGQAVTCLEIGWDAYETCSRCDYTTYSEIPALGHDRIRHDAQAPTCLEVGWDGYETCSRCDYTTYVEIPALGHWTENIRKENDPTYPFTFEDGVYASSNHLDNTTATFTIRATDTCVMALYAKVSSEQNYDKLWIHHNGQLIAEFSGMVDWQQYTLSMQAGDVVTLAYSKDTSTAVGEDTAWFRYTLEEGRIPTDQAEPTCVDPVVCILCDSVLKEALGHDEIHHAGQVVTCLEIGWDAYETCGRCDYTTYCEIPALGHDRIRHDAQAPTCLEVGWDAYETCDRCDYTTYQEIPALGHWAENIRKENDPTYPFTFGDGVYASSNRVDNTTATFTIRAMDTCVMVLYAKVSSEQNYDKLRIHHNGQQIAELSGMVDWQQYTLSMQAGDVVTFAYSKDRSAAGGEDTAWFRYTLEGGKIPADQAEPTCVDPVVCILCDSVLKEALGHDLQQHSAKSPDCTNIGWNAYDTCFRCDYTTYVELPANGHSFMEKICIVCGADQPSDMQWDLSVNGDGSVMAYAYRHMDGTYLLEIVGNGPVKNYTSSPFAYNLSGKIDDIRIFDGVTALGDYLFGNVRILGEVQIANTVTSLGNYVFYEFEGPRTVTLPAGVTSIGNFAFYGAENMIVLLEGDALPERLGSIWDYNCGHYLQPRKVITTADAIYVIDRDGKAWLAKWCENGESFVAETSVEGIPVTGIGAFAMDQKGKIITYTVPAQITAIDRYAFRQCEKLTILFESDTLPEKLGSAWNDEVAYYLAPQKVLQTDDYVYVLGQNGQMYLARYLGYDKNPTVEAQIDGYPLQHIGRYAFRYSNVKSVQLPDTVETIGGYAFHHSLIQSVSLPDRLTTIGTWGFFGADLTSVTIPKNVTVIESNTFSYCEYMKVVYVQSPAIAGKLQSTSSFGDLCRYAQTVVIPADVENSWLLEAYPYSEVAQVQGMECLIYSSCAHSWQAQQITEMIPCQTDGMTLFTCTACGVEKQEITPCHELIHHDAQKATCTEHGWEAYEACSHCDYTTCVEIPASGHNYVDGTCVNCGAADPDYVAPITKPTVSLSYPTLNFKDIVYYNIYYQVNDMTDVVEMGLITFDGALSAGTMDDAAEVIAGYVTSGSNCMVHTNGINAKNLGDALYFKVYAKLSDGSYVYSNLAGYHAVAYAKDILANSTNAKMKSLVVAMLNYGAAAQVQFEYKTDSLMNSFLTEEQKALVSEYSADMVAPVTKVDSSKIGAFGYVAGGYSALYPSVSFEGAFSVKFYFTPAKAMDGDLTMYYWSAADYAAADVLTAENATGVFTMDAISGTYVATVEGIAARQIDETIYVAGIYESNGVSYPTGVIAYSLGTYCLDRVTNGTGNMPAFAKETIVYGYYAKAYFA